MAGRECAALLAAMKDIEAGAGCLESAAKHGVAPSTFTRALRRRGVPPKSTARRNNRKVLPLPEPFCYSDGTPLDTPVHAQAVTPPE
jgi:hypothetical protein